jgi:putative ABC transport system permease protein
MAMLNKLRLRLRALFFKSKMEDELQAELQFHLEREIEENIARGMTPEEARFAALRSFGGVERVKEESRDVRGVRFLEEVWQDLRYGARMLFKNPGFTLVAGLTLSMGIGANVAIFSVVNAVLIQPLPFAEPDRLVWAWGNIRSGGDSIDVSPLDYLDYRAQNTTFEQFAATFSIPTYLNLTGAGEPERLEGRAVTSNFFQALGVNAALGRTFLPENEKLGSERVVVLSQELWRRRFGGDPSIVGKTLTLNGNNYEVIGVAPPSFKFPQGAQLWAPMSFDAEPGLRQRKAHFLRPIGRLKPGVTLAQAQADMDAVARRLEAQYPESNAGWNLRLVPLRDPLVGNIRPTLQMLFGAVGFVLLIACVNVANLSLARAATRQREIAVRMALGAGRLRIARQMLSESMLLALTGGALGVILAGWGVDLIVAFIGDNIPPIAQVGVDRVALTFTLGVSLLTGLLFGLAPALMATWPQLSETLKDGGKGAGQSGLRNRTRSLLVVFETAIAVTLLIGAGLLVRSYIRLQHVNPGFDAANVLTTRMNLAYAKYDSPEKAAAFWEQLHERLAALPGVEAVGMITELPLSGQPNSAFFTVEGRPPVLPGQEFDANFRRVNQDYLRSMRIPRLRGRDFTEQEARQNAKVVLISESLASEVFPNEEPLGKRLRIPQYEPTSFEIVGVVGDIRHRGLDAAPYAAMYLPALSTGWINLTIRAAGDPMSLAAAVRRETRAIDPDQPIGAIRTMEQVLSESVSEPRYRTGLLGLFALVALILAGVGIYGVIAYTTAQRLREIAVRMALGAQSKDVLKLIIGQGIRLSLAGLLLGLGGALSLTRVMKTLLFGISATDPLTFAVIALLLMAVALLACWIPARRATRVDPLVTLRCE